MTNVLSFRANYDSRNDPTEQLQEPASQDYKDMTTSLNEVRDSLCKLNKVLEHELESIAQQLAKSARLGGAGKQDDAFATLVPMTLEKDQGTGSLG